MSKFWAALKKADKILLISMLLIFALGATTLYSVNLAVSSDGLSLLAKQVLYFVLGLGLFGVFMTVDYRLWQPFYPWFFLFSLVALILVFTPFGEVIRGIRAWVDFGLFVWQPVELVKLLLILCLAGYFSKQGRHLKTWKPLIVSGSAAGLLVLLTIAQPDLGSAIILFLVWFGFVILLGLSKWQIGLMLIGFALIALLGWTVFLKDYQKQRLTTFLDPSLDPLGAGYNVTQSIIAIGSGGLFGRGIGFGSQSQLEFLPERQTDFIFAVVAEELGFAGVLLLAVLLGIIAWRIISIAKHTRSDFGQLVAIGVLIALMGQAILNMSMNLGMVPVTGISLPLISAGGSYLMSVMMMLGLVQSIAVHSTGGVD
jgi:rod shape determining protein RodA